MQDNKDNYFPVFKQQIMELINDSRRLAELNSMRVMVAAPLLYAFTIHYIFLGITHFFTDDIKKQRIYDHGRRLVLFGLAGLLSINFLQYGVYHAVLAWLTLIWVFVVHGMTIMRQIKQKYQNYAVFIFYILIAVWFFGIVLFYFLNAFT